MNRASPTVVFSHGRDSGPWGAKISAMAELARRLSFPVESIDYRGIADPALRVAKLIAAVAGHGAPIILVGSSLGGHVSAAAAARVKARGLFLLAPAFYMPGFEAHTPSDVPCRTAIVHGWRDDVVPVENSIRWAREQGATLHLFDSDHRLEDRIGSICDLLRDFLSVA